MPIERKLAAMDEELGKKFPNYPIPKAIVEEWEKVEMLIDHLYLYYALVAQ